jgi:ATPase subunit of ABC transporter with duplicated ATPase domains
VRQQSPLTGDSFTCLDKVGSVAQGATDWMLQESLISQLLITSDISSMDALAQLLVSHKFPLALAQRPLSSLSPGERVRAALICLFSQKPTVEFLVLDEPAYSLDFVGITALQAGLQAWQGGLIIVSHDKRFLQKVGVDHFLHLDGEGGHCISRVQKTIDSDKIIQSVAKKLT